jgi:hypothetical protein
MTRPYVNKKRTKGKMLRPDCFLAAGVLLLAGSLAPAHGQMLDPAIDKPDEPFCFFSKPTDVIGVMDGKEGTLVSPEGYFYTGWGELMFFTGNPQVPVNQRVKTLLKGYLPVIQYSFLNNGIEHHVTAFAATLDGNPESPLINFIRVEINNPQNVRRMTHFSVGLRYQGEASTDWGVADNRFGRPAKAEKLGQFEQAGAEFSREWVYGFEGDMLVRDSALIYMYPPMPKPVQLMLLKMGYNEPQDLTPRKLYVYPATPVGIVQYDLTLAPGEEQTLDFKMPYEPQPVKSAIIPRIRNAGFDEYLKRTVDFWEDILARGIDISVPEEKVVSAFKANLFFDLIARNKQEGFYIQKVNEFNYDAFWLRDASYIVRMYDLSGFHDFARQCLEFFPRWQQPDGNFVSQGGQYDGWGQTMWAYGQHFLITQDREFAERIYPSVRRAVGWLRQARGLDPLHLMPVTTPGDNEEITGHVTGHNFWALVGLKNVIALAEGLGKKEDAEAYKRDYNDLHSALVTVLKKVTSSTHGYMPPGLDAMGGQDWGNMLAVYPEIILDPYDPMVTATLKATRAKYQEGIMTYGNGRWLHHYLTLKNTESEIVRGDQQVAVDELYAYLLHTAATHAGFEYSIFPWGTRDFGMNLSPHGWGSATFRTMLRDMMVREQEGALHLLSVLSPAWIHDGAVVAVKRAPTSFGEVNLELRCRKGEATVEFAGKLSEHPRKIILHLPWFMAISRVEADGKSVKVKAGTVELPASVRKVEIHWSRMENEPVMSYDRTVEEYKTEYRERYEASLHE